MEKRVQELRIAKAKKKKAKKAKKLRKAEQMKKKKAAKKKVEDSSPKGLMSLPDEYYASKGLKKEKAEVFSADEEVPGMVTDTNDEEEEETGRRGAMEGAKEETLGAVRFAVNLSEVLDLTGGM